MKRVALLCALLFLGVGCAPAAGSSISRSAGRPSPQRAKTIVVPILNTVAGFTTVGGNTSNGGWDSIDEIHSNALITTERVWQRWRAACEMSRAQWLSPGRTK